MGCKYAILSGFCYKTIKWFSLPVCTVVEENTEMLQDTVHISFLRHWTNFGLQNKCNPSQKELLQNLKSLTNSILFFLQQIFKLLYRYWRWESCPFWSSKLAIVVQQCSNLIMLAWQNAEVHLHGIQTMTELFHLCWLMRCHLGKLDHKAHLISQPICPHNPFQYLAMKGNNWTNRIPWYCCPNNNRSSVPCFTDGTKHPRLGVLLTYTLTTIGNIHKGNI